MYALSVQTEYTGAIVALLDEYQKALSELKGVIENLDEIALSEVRDAKTPDKDCRSIASILSHVISSGTNYTLYIREQIGEKRPYSRPKPLETAQEYCQALDELFASTVQLFQDHPDVDLLIKLQVPWGQDYDAEQLMEHAIVHILRHRRQIQKFLS